MMNTPQPQLEQLSAHIERIRASQVLSRAEGRLFDFLAERSLAGRTPKEIEIAIEVFGRSAGSTIEDATVRVNIHKLRRKLDEYYLAAGREEVDRIVIPRGEYRLVLQPMRSATLTETPALEIQSATEVVVKSVVQELLPRRRRGWITFIAAVVIINLLVWAMLLPKPSPTARAMQEVRSHVVWHGIVESERPIYVVVGDYYIFGELGGATLDVRRLVREFNINSRNDLEQYLINNPQLADRYMDVSLQYLPISVAQALQQVFPVLNTDEKASDRVRVILSSELTPAMLKSGHVIYVGLLSGLGILRGPAFTGSQFEFGDSYDELVNRKDGKHYISQAAQVADSRTLYRDYGYFSTVTGPTGNRLVIIAGTRDVAAIHTAVAVTRSTSLVQLVTQAGVTANFEALYAVNAIDRTDLNGRLLLASQLSTAMRP